MISIIVKCNFTSFVFVKFCFFQENYFLKKSKIFNFFLNPNYLIKSNSIIFNINFGLQFLVFYNFIFKINLKINP